MPETQAAVAPDNGQTLPQEIQDQMQTSLALFNGGQMPTQVAPQETTQQPTDTTVINEPQAVPMPVTFDVFKEKYGYASPEDAFKEIEELRAAKEKYLKPFSVEDIQFENEDSAKLFKHLTKGERKDVYKILEQQERLDSLLSTEITENSADDIIKSAMELKYKKEGLSQKEIEYSFNKKFGYPKAPVFDENKETQDEFDARKAEWQSVVDDIKMSKVIEAKMLRPELELAKTKIVFPELAPDIDEGYEQYKKSLQEQQTSTQAIVDSYKSLTPESIGMKLDFKDEANKVEHSFDYKPDEKGLQEVLEVVADFNKFFTHFQKPDGTPDKEAFAQAIHFALHRSEIIKEVQKQSTNGTIKSKLPDNTQGGLVRHLADTAATKNEIDEMMKVALAVR